MDWLCAVCCETDLAKNDSNEPTKYSYNNTVIQISKVNFHYHITENTYLCYSAVWENKQERSNVFVKR